MFTIFKILTWWSPLVIECSGDQTCNGECRCLLSVYLSVVELVNDSPPIDWDRVIWDCFSRKLWRTCEECRNAHTTDWGCRDVRTHVSPAYMVQCGYVASSGESFGRGDEEGSSLDDGFIGLPFISFSNCKSCLLVLSDDGSGSCHRFEVSRGWYWSCIWKIQR